jgi:hypothetical protein
MKRAINWAVTATNPKSLSPDGIGRLDFDHVFWTESLIRRLICVECFRVASSKSLIGQGYTNASAVRQNLLGLLTENPEVHALFERCWTKTETSRAILTKKTVTGVASLNPHASAISDTDVREDMLNGHFRIR